MFDYFKKMKQTQHEAEENEPQESKPKKDIVFIIILIMFGAIIAVGLITGINDLAGDTAQDTNLVFRFSVTDGIILGGITERGENDWRIRKRNSHRNWNAAVRM